jgi:hypothetical protein
MIRRPGGLLQRAGLLECVLEAKASNEGTGGDRNDDNRFVGLVYLALIPGREIHRDGLFGIALGAPDAWRTCGR